MIQNKTLIFAVALLHTLFSACATIEDRRAGLRTCVREELSKSKRTMVLQAEAICCNSYGFSTHEITGHCLIQ